MNYMAFAAACGLALAGVLLFAAPVSATHMALSGFAWSADNLPGGVGWIALSCHTGSETGGEYCATSDFGVSMRDLDGDSSTLELEGEMWSGDDCGDLDPATTCGIGWIVFDASFGAPPGAPGPFGSLGLGYSYAQYNLSTGQLYGWARSARCFGAPLPAECGGWDGWIKLSNLDGTDPLGTPPYGVVREIAPSCNLSGYAWGGGDEANFVGWVSFQHGGALRPQLTGGVCAVAGQPVASPTREEELYCASLPSVNLIWSYFDPNTPPSSQSGYDIEVATSSATDPDGTFVNAKIHHALSNVVSSSQVHTIELTNTSPPEANKLQYNQTYYWHVRVRNSQSPPAQSNWSTVKQFENPTPPNRHPIALFTMNPAVPFANEEVQFTDLSRQFASDPVNGAACTSSNPLDSSYCTFNWTFSNPLVWECVNPVAGCEFAQNPKIKYTQDGQTSATLNVFDSAGLNCAHSISPVFVGKEIPDWREISPRR